MRLISLFDMTLIDSSTLYESVFHRMESEHGIKIGMTMEEIWPYPYVPLMKKISENNEGTTWEEIDVINKKLVKDAYKNSKIEHISTLKEINDSGIYFSIISNNSGDIIKEALSNNGNDILNFNDIYGNEDFKDHGTKTDMINLIVEQNNFDKSQVMYIGDSLKDMHDAIKADVIPVGISTGLHSTKELKKEGAKIVLSNLSELKDHIF